MKRTSVPSTSTALGALIVCIVLLTGCSYHVMPTNASPVKAYESVSLDGCSVIVTTADAGTTDYTILNEKGENTGLVTTRQDWSKKLVEALARELARRGAQVRTSAPLKLGLSVPEIKLFQDGERFRFAVKVTVSSSSGWNKQYYAEAVTVLGNFESVDTMADRLAGQVLSEAVKTMLGDADFIDHVCGLSQKVSFQSVPSARPAPGSDHH
jgi:uncharacterized lipoprotein YajG